MASTTKNTAESAKRNIKVGNVSGATGESGSSAALDVLAS